MTGSERADAPFSKEPLQITCDIDDVVHYVALHNDVPFVNSICVKNLTEDEIDDVDVVVSMSGGFAEDFRLHIDRLRPGEERFLNNLKIALNADKLLNLTERVTCPVKIEAFQGDRVVGSETQTLSLLAYDEWPGYQNPEFLASFVMPNHPVIAELAHKASELLREWTGSPSLDSYQSKDRDRVKKMAAAIFTVIQQENITYAVAPSSFEKYGQRVRLPDAILEQRMGNCMDMTLLYAACLEFMGLHPILVSVKGHIFAGAWLIDASYPEMIVDDPTLLEKQASSGVSEILVVECTMMCSGQAAKFDDAVAQALNNLSKYDDFIFAYDVKRARLLHVVPLPYRIKTNDGYKIEPKKRDDVDLRSPSELGETVEPSPTPAPPVVDKKGEWERKLLDLSLRNSLINMKFGSSYLPLPTTELSNLEDLLAEGTVFQIHAFPSEASIPQKGASIETLKATEQQYQALIAAELEHKRLLTLYPEKELKTSLTKMYRAAKSAAEENGVSSLYLAFGLLKWHDPAASASKASEYYAPIVMIPVELIRKSANDGYVLQASDEAADVNVTLLEFLRQNFEIEVEGLDPLPTDDSGLDLKKIFAHIRHAIMNRPGWDVVESCCLGNFTFSQFVMWREVHNGEEFLKNCKATRALMTGDTSFAPPGLNAIDRDEAFAPVSLDASQLHAVKLAAADASFILHGPPGTGKSQTITAMIVNALAQGKRVLFVAEKMAALEVVKSRLDKLGFSAFCLELHSNKASKKETLERLQRAAELDGERFHTQYARKRKELLDRRQDLDQYRIALHKPRDFGKTLRQIVDLYESIPDRGQYVYFTPEFIDALNEPELERLRQSLSEFVHAADEIDVEALQPLEIIKEDQQFGQRMKFDLEPLLQTYLNELEAFRDALDAFAETTGLKPPLKVAEIEEARRFAKETIASQSVPDFIKTTPNLDVELRVPEGYLTIQEEFLAREGLLRKKWRDDFLVDDMARFKDEYETATVKKLFFKTWALKKLARKLQIYVKEGSDFKVEPNEIQRLLADVKRFQESKRKYEAAKETLSENWRLFFQENPTKEAFQEFKKNVLEWRRGVGNPERYRSLVESGRWEETLERGGRLKERYRLLCLAQKALEEIVALKGDSDSDDWIAARIAFSKAALANLSDLKKWFAFRARRRQCQSLGLGKVCELYKKGAPDSALVDVFLRSVYRRLAVGIIDSEPFLNEFSGTNFNLWIKRFKELDEEFMELVKLEALNRLYERRENELRATSTVLEELKNLKKWSKSSRNVALRSIFTQIPTILPALCPCMLMSPLSVAQYLEAKNDMFDLVIFDEASQIPTCKAVGTIARAKNAVIAGDPLQMPPTSFFAVGDSSDDEATVLTEDLKSVLDDCLALGMREAVLRWHYRSRHESLIAFSNKEFYEPEGKAMSTFPSVNDRERRVKFVKVEGIFERGRKRVNRQEAEAIVAEIKRRFADPTLAEFSIGVVTFNAPQQELIEDMLQEECQRDPEFDAWVNDGKGALFVKNLENVQGDERDVILFSIAFAPDADGKFLLNFGPISKDGGWKRLNVAVTRARSEMVVFSSITYDMIDQRRTKAKGVNALRNFLEFAQKGTLRGEYVETTARKNEGILEKICQRLAEKGYRFQRGIGRSSFKIDLGVVNPVDEDEYILGILLDGDVYFKTLDPKDREISQKAALENLGWNVYRIWTMDWWEDSEKELEKLLATLEELKQKNEPSSADADSDSDADSDADANSDSDAN